MPVRAGRGRSSCATGAGAAERVPGIDTATRRSYHRAMPLWLCPHCGTPQAESARCWVCRKSSTSCATCRHFRNAVAAQLGYCGLDRRRQPLRGDEMRGCWEGAAAAPIGIGARTADTIAPLRPSIAWTEVDATRPGRELSSPVAVATVTADAPATATAADAPSAIATADRIGESSVGSQAGAVPAGLPRLDAAPSGLWGEIDR